MNSSLMVEENYCPVKEIRGQEVRWMFVGKERVSFFTGQYTGLKLGNYLRVQDGWERRFWIRERYITWFPRGRKLE